MKIFIVISIVMCAFLLMSIGAYAEQSTSQPTIPSVEKTKDRASRAMNNMLYGPVEVPQNIDETKTKGTKIDSCTEKTRTGVERGIGRIFAGAWQLATFWYSDPGAVTSTKSGVAQVPSSTTK